MNMTETVGKHFIVRTLPALLATAMLLSAAGTSFGCPLPVPTYSNDTILVQKQITSKKHRIKLFQNNDENALFFSVVRGLEGKVYQLFLFDISGNLVSQANIKSKQTTVIDNIEKGSYLFEVFSDDERIENGQVIIR
jgi:hypothetical protein